MSLDKLVRKEKKLARGLIDRIPPDLAGVLPNIREIVYNTTAIQRGMGTGKAKRKYIEPTSGTLGVRLSKEPEIDELYLPHIDEIYEIFIESFMKARELDNLAENTSQLRFRLPNREYIGVLDFLKVYARNDLTQMWEDSDYKVAESTPISKFVGLKATIEGDQLKLDQNGNIRRAWHDKPLADTTKYLVVVTHALSTMYLAATEMQGPKSS